MKTNVLTTKVTAVPSKDHQRMYSSLPLGKNKRASAKIVGIKMHSDIIKRSDSIVIMEAISCYPRKNIWSSEPERQQGFANDPHRRSGSDERSRSAHRVRPRIQKNPQSHPRQGQEQHIAADVARLHVAQRGADVVRHV